VDDAAALIRLVLLSLAVAALAGAPLAAQPGAELAMRPIVAPPACDPQGLDIVVCGRRVPADRYRIPPELRDDRTNPVNPSWSARARDERETGRYDGQIVGPAGAFGQWTEMVCQWRAERQQLAGHPPDCTRRVRRPGN
jgi:hypothetical protein